MHKNFFVVCCLFIILSNQASAIPPPVPSAGVVERQLEKDYEATPIDPEREMPAIQIDIPEERLDMPEGKKIFIHQIKIIGNESISNEEIALWCSDRLSRELSILDIYELCHHIEQQYAQQGYFLARAYPPPQTIENEMLWIEVIEGRLGNIEVVGNEYYSDEFILSYFAPLQNRSLQYDEFIAALML